MRFGSWRGVAWRGVAWQVSRVQSKTNLYHGMARTVLIFLSCRIDDTPQFLASALASCATEWVGALLGARMAHIAVGQIGPGKSSWAPSRVIPEQEGPREGASPHAAGKFSQSPPSQSLASPSELIHDRKLLLATRVAHEELGEKVALCLGCAAALWLGGLSAESATRAIALCLLEAASDVAKSAAYASSDIQVGRVTFALHLPSLLGVALVGGASWLAMLAAIRFNCLP